MFFSSPRNQGMNSGAQSLLLPTLPRKTTRTAQYAAAAAKASCRFARVKRDTAVENARVKSNSVPIHIESVFPEPALFTRCHRMYMGTTRRTRIIMAIIVEARKSTRDLVKYMAIPSVLRMVSLEQNNGWRNGRRLRNRSIAASSHACSRPGLSVTKSSLCCIQVCSSNRSGFLSYR